MTAWAILMSLMKKQWHACHAQHSERRKKILYRIQRKKFEGCKFLGLHSFPSKRKDYFCENEQTAICTTEFECDCLFEGPQPAHGKKEKTALNHQTHT